jgi:capsular exopolysaccharide synthesis family protein
LLGAENERKTAEANYRAALAPGVAEALVPGAGVPTPEESKVLELKQRRAQLLVENTEEWPEVQQIDRQIAVLEKQIAEGNNRSKTVTIVNLETKYRQALAREQALREAFQKQRSETVTQNEAAINYRIIQQETATNKALLNSLLQRYKENDLILAGTANNIRVSDYALAPSSPTGPKRLQIVALAFIVSLSVGLALAIGLGYLDNTMRSAADVERHLGLPALAVIPAIGNGATRPPLLGRFNLVPFNKQNGNGHQRPLLLNGDIHSPMAEVYRKLRTSVLLFGKRPPKTVLVTSSLPSEGKTTTAINTALVLSRPEAKVLLIDADMRQPSVHHIFGIPNESGLSDILSGDMTEEEINSLIIRDEVSGLYILPAGPAAVNPAELLTSERMLYLLVTLGSSFGHIVVDSPPIAPFTDSVLIALLVDGVLLVVEGGKSSLDVVQSSQRVLEDVGSKILGVVLNKVDMPATNHYYQYYQRVQA